MNKMNEIKFFTAKNLLGFFFFFLNLDVELGSEKFKLFILFVKNFILEQFLILRF